MFAGALRFDTPTARLRAVTLVEGISYLLLLFIAMPLKYWAGLPMAVRIVGSVHGFLFMLLAWLVLQGMRERERSLGWGMRIGIASLLPFATFFLDRGLAEEDAEYRSRSGA